MTTTPLPGLPRDGTAMVRTFGWLHAILGLGWSMSRVRFEEHSVERVARANAAGPVVYVLLRRSVVDYMAANAVLNRRALPIAEWSNGPGLGVFASIEAYLRRRIAWLRPAADPVADGSLREAILAGRTTALFLQDPDLPIVSTHAGPVDDALRVLLEAQATCGRPIQVVPLLCVWDVSPDQARSMSMRFLMGAEADPGIASTLAALYLPSSKAPFVQAGEPVDLAEFMRREVTGDAVASLREVLHRFLDRETKVVRGPQLVPYQVLKHEILDDDPILADEAAAFARAQGKSSAQVRRAMGKELDAVAARFSIRTIRWMAALMKPLWTRVFSGYDIRDEDLERIRVASRRGAPVLVSCHKSHFDYLLLSWVFYHADMVVPHIVAGINLAIWPVSAILRGCGAFFIRRNFSPDTVHPMVFSAYLRQLIRRGYPVEFFIEGGRTRTGLLLRPKLGVLGMVVDAARRDPDHVVTLLPIGLSYEEVAEQATYRKELSGAEKQAESMGQLIAARSVLSRRFGRVHIRVEEPIRLAPWLADQPDWATLPPREQRSRLQELGDRLTHRIGRAIVVLPTSVAALALTAHDHRAIRHGDLLERGARMLRLLDRWSCERSTLLDRPETALLLAVERFARYGILRGHPIEGGRIWEIVPAERVALDFHKNQVVHFFAPCVLLATALHKQGTDHVDVAQATSDWHLLVELLHRELTFDPDTDDETRIASAFDDLQAYGAITAEGDGWRRTDLERLGELRALMAALLESYGVVLRAIAAQGSEPFEAKAFLKTLQTTAEARLLEGSVQRPEAMTSVALGNALQALVDMELVTAPTRTTRRADLTRLSALLARLDDFQGPA